MNIIQYAMREKTMKKTKKQILEEKERKDQWKTLKFTVNGEKMLIDNLCKKIIATIAKNVGIEENKLIKIVSYMSILNNDNNGYQKFSFRSVSHALDFLQTKNFFSYHWSSGMILTELGIELFCAIEKYRLNDETINYQG